MSATDVSSDCAVRMLAELKRVPIESRMDALALACRVVCDTKLTIAMPSPGGSND